MIWCSGRCTPIAGDARIRPSGAMSRAGACRALLVRDHRGESVGKALLLTGEKKVGKTTAVRNIVTSLGEDHFVGFYATERREQGLRTGFGIAMLDGREGTLATIESESDLRVGRVIDGRVKYGVELGFLEDVAI